MTETYRVYALKYATRDAKRADHFLGGDPDPDKPMPMDYYIWLCQSDERTVLVDTGFKPDVAAKRGRVHLRSPSQALQAFGVDAASIQDIVLTHTHYDHAGGIAALQRASHATVLAGKAGADAILHGRGDRRDPQFESGRAFDPAQNVRAVTDGETIKVGDIAITAHATPGHTPGGMTWTWQSCAGKNCLDMVYADSLTAVSDDDYRFGDDAAHPGVEAAFRRSIATVGGLPCDLLMTAHPDASAFWERKASTMLIDHTACRRYAERALQALDRRIADENAKAHP